MRERPERVGSSLRDRQRWSPAVVRSGGARPRAGAAQRLVLRAHAAWVALAASVLAAVTVVALATAHNTAFAASVAASAPRAAAGGAPSGTGSLVVDPLRRAILRATLSDAERARLARAPLPAGGGETLPAAVSALAAPELSDPALTAVDSSTGLPYAWHLAAVQAPVALALQPSGIKVAIVDTGADLAHPDLRDAAAATVDLLGTGSVADLDGHGTFIAGLIAARAGNGLGSAGVAGKTPLVIVRASTGARFRQSAIADGILAAVRRGARIINLSVEAPTIGYVFAAALARAVELDTLVVAAAGNSGDVGNAPQQPAALLGGYRGSVGSGLSVAATLPDGRAASFSTRNTSVSVAAPGAMADCRRGVFSTLPLARDISFDDDSRGRCLPLVFAPGRFASGRYAYGQGTSFAAPIVAGVAALVWAAQPRLHSDQVARILMRTARQRDGSHRWTPATGYGVVNAVAAVQLARRFDVTPPPARARLRALGRGVWTVRVLASSDPRRRGQLSEGGVRYALVLERGGVRRLLAGPSQRPPKRRVSLPAGTRRARLYVVACDRVLNCAHKTFALRR